MYYLVDHGMFYKQITKDILIIVASINNLALLSITLQLLEWLKRELNKVFEMSDFGEIYQLLSMEIKQNFKACTILLSQYAYVDTIVSHFNLKNMKVLTIPLDPNFPLSYNQSLAIPHKYNKMQNVPFYKAVGLAIYTIVTMYPDIAHTVSHLAQYMQNPRKVH